MRVIWIMIFAVFVSALPVQPMAQEAPVIAEEELESRARDVGRSLRCVVCQNQSIEESDATLAEDMRTIVRARIRKGETNDEVMAYMQSRYGDFVLLDPPVQRNTYVLWGFPFVLLMLGFIWFWRAAIKAKVKSADFSE